MCTTITSTHEDALFPGAVVTAMTLEDNDYGTSAMVIWNGSSTFNVWAVDPCAGQWTNVDCFTAYPNSNEEALRVSKEHLVSSGLAP